jgi:hypothetical protein
MTPQSPCRQYRVSFRVWECFERVIEARDETEAENLALELVRPRRHGLVPSGRSGIANFIGVEAVDDSQC